MFVLADSESIGNYLAELVSEQFKNQNDFCREWLKEENLPDSDLGKRANKFSQIKQGNKGVQIEDLPAICKLLHISCEELLSAGKVFKPDTERLTNYSVAFSKNDKLWEEYINYPQKLILNPDEYGKTALDYAVQFKNIEFIAYLIDKGYIWFDAGITDRKTLHYRLDFGAGTSIKGRNIGDVDYYMPQQLRSKNLRMRLIALAIECNSLEILQKMVAREFPYFYHVTFYTAYNEMEFEDYYNPDVIANIGKAADEIVDYFTDEFVLQDELKHEGETDGKYFFMYPFISEVLNELVKQKHTFTEAALKKAIAHNKKIYENVKKLVVKSVDESYKEFYVGYEQAAYQENISRLKELGYPAELCNKEEEKLAAFRSNVKKELLEKTMKDICISKQGNFVKLSTSAGQHYIKFISNIVHVRETPSEGRLKQLTKELNDYYEKIIHIQNELLAEEEA